MIARTTLLAAAALLLGGAARADEPQLREPAVHTIDVAGQARSYALDRHDAAGAQGPLPIIVFLPGSGVHLGEPLPLRFDLPFAAVPGLGPALIVQAQGANRHWDSLPGGVDTWQRPSDLEGRFVDDTGFLRALVGELVAHEGGDPRRVYVAGVSSGGYMAARVACEMPDVVAAAADVIATMRTPQTEACREGPSVPFLLMASTTDPTNLYRGAEGNPLDSFASAPETVQVFADRDGCRTRAETPLPTSPTCPPPSA